MYIPCMDPLGHSHSLGMSTLLGKKYTGVRFDQYPTYPTSFSLKRPYVASKVHEILDCRHHSLAVVHMCLGGNM